MAIAEKLEYLNGTKQAIKTAIQNRGVNVSDTDTFRDYSTKIGDIGETVDKTKFGASIDNILGDVDADGLLLPPESFNLTATGIKKLQGSSGFESIFEKNTSVRDVVFPDLEFVGLQAMSYSFSGSGITSIIFSKLTNVENDGLNRTFYNCLDLTSAAFPALVANVGANGFNYTFAGCIELVTVDLSVLEELGATNQIFYRCLKLKNVKLDSLKKITGMLSAVFYNCTGLERIDFPALTSIVSNAFGTGSSSYLFRSCTQAGLEIHFRADMQATIEALTGYENKWGATNATIYFDL